MICNHRLAIKASHQAQNRQRFFKCLNNTVSREARPTAQIDMGRQRLAGRDNRTAAFECGVDLGFIDQAGTAHRNHMILRRKKRMYGGACSLFHENMVGVGRCVRQCDAPSRNAAFMHPSIMLRDAPSRYASSDPSPTRHAG